MLNEEISSLVGGLSSSSNSSLSAFARMEQKVEALEAEADAAGQMGVSPRSNASRDLQNGPWSADLQPCASHGRTGADGSLSVVNLTTLVTHLDELCSALHLDT